MTWDTVSKPVVLGMYTFGIPWSLGVCLDIAVRSADYWYFPLNILVASVLIVCAVKRAVPVLPSVYRRDVGTQTGENQLRIGFSRVRRRYSLARWSPLITVFFWLLSFTWLKCAVPEPTPPARFPMNAFVLRNTFVLSGGFFFATILPYQLSGCPRCGHLFTRFLHAPRHWRLHRCPTCGLAPVDAHAA